MDLQDLLVTQNVTLRFAMEKINDSGYQIVFMLNTDGLLMGSLSDGDIRRAILNGANLESRAEQFINRNPFCVAEISEARRAQDAMSRLALKCVPVVKEQKIIHIFASSELGQGANFPCTVLIMAGGRGERLNFLTESKPKPMIPVGGKPLIQILVERLAGFGLIDIWISVHYLADKITDYLGDGSQFGVKIQYIFEKTPLGTAGSYLKLPKSARKLPVLICNSDLITTIDFIKLLENHYTSQAQATISVVQHITKIPYGVIVEESSKLVNLVEKPSIANWVSAGIGVFNDAAFTGIPTDKPVNITEVYEKLIQRNLPINVYKEFGYWQDVGTQENLRSAIIDLGSGVTGDL